MKASQLIPLLTPVNSLAYTLMLGIVMLFNSIWKLMAFGVNPLQVTKKLMELSVIDLDKGINLFLLLLINTSSYFLKLPFSRMACPPASHSFHLFFSYLLSWTITYLLLSTFLWALFGEATTLSTILRPTTTYFSCLLSVLCTVFFLCYLCNKL